MAKEYNYSNPAADSSSLINRKTGGFSLGGFLDDVLNFVSFGDSDFSTDFWNEISGRNSQEREFEQQEYLMDKQNDYNSPVNQMARAKEAGINPNLVAQGVASSNTSATPSSVSSNTQGGAQALQTIASAVSGLAPLASEINKNNSSADLDIAHTITENQSREDLIAKLKSDCGLNEANSSFISTQIKYYGREANARITNLYANQDLARQQIQLYQSQIEKIEHELNLIDKEADYELWLAKTQEYISYQQQWYSDFMQEFQLDPRSPLDSQFVQLAKRFGIDSQEAINFATLIQDYNQAYEQSRFNFDMAKIDKEFENMLEQIGTTIDAETKSKIKTAWIELTGKLLGAGASVGSAFILK